MKINLFAFTPLAFGIWLAAGLTGQLRAQTVLDEYIRDGLDNNLVLQQKELSLDQAQQSLRIARSYFLPSVSLLADYTSGDGGRSFDIPVGDLLNPVYASLNQLTQSDAFPQIENVSQNFFPKNFYDARIRTSVPLVNTDLTINRSIQGQQVLLGQYELEIYKRELVFDIKTAYFNYLAGLSAIKIQESALRLVNKNMVINESLLNHGKTLPAHYLRSKSEVEQVKADLNSAKNRASNARKYFNFLLNRDLDAEVDTNFSNGEITLPDTSLMVANQREEIKMISTALEINRSTLQMHKLTRVPKVNAFVDLGSQANDWQVNEQSQYYLVGVQLSLPLFQGFRTHSAIRKSSLEVQKSELNRANTTTQLEMAAEISRNDLQTAIQNYLASMEQLKAAQSYFNLVEKGYQQGVHSLIEFLDARTQLTTSELQQNLRFYEMLTAAARLERETSSYTFNNN